MLGKRTRPTMRRTSSMSQLGSASNIEKMSPVRENDVFKEKQKIPMSIAPQFRSPTPGSSAMSAPVGRNLHVKQIMNRVSLNPYRIAFGDGAFAEGMGMVYPTQGYDTVHEHFHHQHARGQGQFQTLSGHSGLYSSLPVGNSSTMGRANVVSGDQSFHGTETFPSSSGRGYGVQMVEPAHFLQACFLCKRRLGHGRDIYMYRDDRAFCTVECRDQQILIDERKEKLSVKVMTTGSLPSDLFQNIGVNSQSGRTKNIQSERRAAA